MLIKLAKIVKKSFRNLGKKGYTLVEVAAVVAVTATMAAVVVPVALDKVKEAKKASAFRECKEIGAAIAAFYKDTGMWPAANATTPDHYGLLLSGNSMDNKASEASDLTGKWYTSVNIDFMENHLVQDSPGGTIGVYRTIYKVNWKGPYCDSLEKTDPWGKNYVAYVRAMHTPNQGIGWVLSAGPNQTLDTDPTDLSVTKPAGDDIGCIVYSYRSKVTP